MNDIVNFLIIGFSYLREKLKWKVNNGKIYGTSNIKKAQKKQKI